MYKVIYVISTLDLGGAENHLASVVPELLPHQVRPIVFSLTGRGTLAEKLESHGVPVHSHWGASFLGKMPRFLRALVRPPLAFFAIVFLIVRFRPQVIHMFLPAAYILGGIAAVMTRIPVRVMSRRSRNHYQRNHPFAKTVERLLHQSMSALVGNSARVVEDLLDESGRDRDIFLLHNGIRLPATTSALDKQACRTALGIEADVLVITITANLFPYKGHMDLIDALSSVKDKLGSKWLLLCIGGDRGMLSSLKKYAQAAGIGSNVRWLGSRDDVSDLLRASDLGVLCSHEEGFSNAVLEYMGAGLPSVVTDVGGNSEAVLNNICGFVVPPRDVAGIGAAVVRLSEDSALRTLMGAAARERVERKFTLDICVNKYLRLYESLFDENTSLQGRGGRWRGE